MYFSQTLLIQLEATKIICRPVCSSLDFGNNLELSRKLEGAFLLVLGLVRNARMSCLSF